VLGPLPPLYRVVVAGCALLACVSLGAWLADLLPDALLASSGARIGAVVVAVAVLLLVHAPRRSSRPLRATSRPPGATSQPSRATSRTR
jgi:hypothetical protein